MNKFTENIKKYHKSYIITLIVSLLVGLGIFLAFLLAEKSKYIGAMDGTGVSSAALAGLSALLWIGKLGAYDSMSYGFKQMFSSMFGKSANKYHDFASYKEEKNNQRKSSSKYYFVSLTIGVLFFIAYIILLALKPSGVIPS